MNQACSSIIFVNPRFAGLVRYLHPSDEELRVFAPPPIRDKREKKKVQSELFLRQENKLC